MSSSLTLKIFSKTSHVNIQNVVRRLVESIDIINEIAIILVTNTSTRISEISIISSSCGPWDWLNDIIHI